MRSFFFLPILIFLECPVLSQPLSDSLFLVGIQQNMKNHYSNLLNSEAPIFNGRMYHSYGKLSDNGHAFFFNNRYTPGTIVYDGYIFNSVKMMYDLIRDQLVLQHFDGVTDIAVMSDHINSFSLHNHNYVHVRSDSTRNSNAIKAGYYDLLYEGKVALLAKRTKIVMEKVTKTEVEKIVSQDDRYYLLKNSTYTSIRNKKALLALLRSTQSENQHFIKTNRLNFKKDKENAILKLVQFHDSIVE